MGGWDGDRAGGQRRWTRRRWVDGEWKRWQRWLWRSSDEADRPLVSRQMAAASGWRGGNETDEENCFGVGGGESVHWRGLVLVCGGRSHEEERWSVLRYEEGVRFRSGPASKLKRLTQTQERDGDNEEGQGKDGCLRSSDDRRRPTCNSMDSDVEEEAEWACANQWDLSGIRGTSFNNIINGVGPPLSGHCFDDRGKPSGHIFLLDRDGGEAISESVLVKIQCGCC
nr:hypothetical protein Iba_chr01bCG5100 [Ipomoea batatas]